MSGPQDDASFGPFDWVAKAEADIKAATGLDPVEPGLADIVCFHCQQCVEKYLKGLVAAQGGEPQRTHDLLDLLTELGLDVEGAATVARPLHRLNPFGVLIRYPGVDATPEEAFQAVRAALQVRAWARELLGLHDDENDND